MKLFTANQWLRDFGRKIVRQGSENKNRLTNSSRTKHFKVGLDNQIKVYF